MKQFVVQTATFRNIEKITLPTDPAAYMSIPLATTYCLDLTPDYAKVSKRSDPVEFENPKRYTFGMSIDLKNPQPIEKLNDDLASSAHPFLL